PTGERHRFGRAARVARRRAGWQERRRAGSAHPRAGAKDHGADAMNVLQELRALDPRDPGRWPMPVRALGVLACFVAASLAMIYFFVWSSQMPLLQQAEQKEQQLRNEYSTKHAKAVNLAV